MTFGGGYAMMPMFQKELIEKRHWITDEELLDYYAIGQSTPGIVAINVSTFIGYKQMGIIGGIFATMGMVLPSLVIIMVIARIIDSIDEFPLVQKALQGVNVAVAALLTKVSFTFARKTVKNLFSFAVAFLAFFLMYFLKVQSFFIMAGTILFGLVIYFVQNPIKWKKKTESQTAGAPENVSGAEENISQTSEIVCPASKTVTESENVSSTEENHE